MKDYASAYPELHLTNSTTGTASTDGTDITLDGSDLIIRNRESGNLRMYTSASERMRIDSSGNCRITAYNGTTGSPSESADWPTPALAIRTYDGYYKNSVMSFGYAGDSEYQTGNNVWNLRLWDTNNTYNISTSSSTTGLELLGPGSLILGAGTSERLRIDTNGNVGIGTSSPSSKLHIHYAAAAYNTVDDVLRLVSKFTSSNNAASAYAESGPAIVFAGGIGDNQTRDRARIVAPYEGGNTSGLAFHTQNTADIITEKMRIQNNGNVGIGTSSPGAKLSIAGATGGNNTALLVGQGGNGNIKVRHIEGKHYETDVNDGLYLNYYGAGTISMCQGGGNVGIGTSSPNAQLEINHDSSWSTFMINGGGGTGNLLLQNYGNTSSGSMIADQGNGPIRLRTSGVDRMWIRPDGKVGIGLSSVSAGNVVHIKGDSNTHSPLKIERPAGNCSVEFRNDSVNAYVGLNTSDNLCIGHSADQSSAPFQVRSDGKTVVEHLHAANTDETTKQQLGSMPKLIKKGTTASRAGQISPFTSGFSSAFMTSNVTEEWVTNGVDWSARSVLTQELLTLMGRTNAKYMTDSFEIRRVTATRASGGYSFPYQSVTFGRGFTTTSAAFVKWVSGPLPYGHWCTGLVADGNWHWCAAYKTGTNHHYTNTHPYLPANDGTPSVLLVALPGSVDKRVGEPTEWQSFNIAAFS